MGKPQPPDQERIELVINGDDPESHKQAQETARILSAPQLARTIQQRIDECRKQIAAVTTALNQCDKVIRMDSEMSYGYYQGVSPPAIRKMSHEVQIVCAAKLAETYDVYCQRLICFNDVYEIAFSVKGHEVIKRVLTENLPSLFDRLKKYEEQFDDLFAIVKGK